MKQVAVAFGCGLEHQPETLADFRAYVDASVAEIEMTDVGKELAAFILDPQLPLGLHVPFAPLLALFRLFTLGSLPEGIRAQLHADWGPEQAARYERAQRVVRGIFRITPRPLRTASTTLQGPVLLRMAARHVRQFDERQRSRATARQADPAAA